MGVSASKRLLAIAGTLSALGQQRVAPVSLERLVGKHGFCHSYRPTLRSVFESVYMDVQRGSQKSRSAAKPWSPASWTELLFSTILMPYAQ
eukprot:8296787-Heterocapsa_arctica.AAC.1